MNPKHYRPGRQIERSVKAIAKQRGKLQDFSRPSHLIRKPYKMRTSEFQRRLAILQRHEKLLAQAMVKKVRK